MTTPCKQPFRISCSQWGLISPEYHVLQAWPLSLDHHPKFLGTIQYTTSRSSNLAKKVSGLPKTKKKGVTLSTYARSEQPIHQESVPIESAAAVQRRHFPSQAMQEASKISRVLSKVLGLRCQGGIVSSIMKLPFLATQTTIMRHNRY